MAKGPRPVDDIPNAIGCIAMALIALTTAVVALVLSLPILALVIRR